jgi:predicted RNase H-like nuclease (RuvC/YqgF family)
MLENDDNLDELYYTWHDRRKFLSENLSTSALDKARTSLSQLKSTILELARMTGCLKMKSVMQKGRKMKVKIVQDDDISDMYGRDDANILAIENKLSRNAEEIEQLKLQLANLDKRSQVYKAIQDLSEQEIESCYDFTMN